MPHRKIVDLKTLKEKIFKLRSQGKKIAFTNGCFDILHLGHIVYLRAAKGRDRVLIIGLNSDQSIRKIKGPRRPILPQKARALLLASLECVDFITIFNEETPLKLIKAVRPDILIKGADWKGKDVAGSHVVKASGGQVQYIKYIPGYSTSGIIEKVIHAYRRK